ncbi:tRNA-uridine aminocarboxypropyltransferase [Thalassotalea fusca]
MHAVHQLYFYRKSLATKAFNARGKGVNRCEYCRVALQNCVCAFTPQTSSNHAVLLLMHDIEVLKPSNTGKLIADVIPNTYAHLWQRNEYPQTLVDIIERPDYQPVLVFPSNYTIAEQPLIDSSSYDFKNKKFLFIYIDGSWREAKKIYRKSPYLHNIPVLSIDPQVFLADDYQSKYHIRKASKSNQLATAEVAALALALAGEDSNAQLLSAWFEAYSYQYQRSVCQPNKGDPLAWQRYEQLVSSLGVSYRSDINNE